jgi:bifunctional DNA-binding transcriptional regulator/antitoxin component of YhaV-PrlF toxin-antitoxin module
VNEKMVKFEVRANATGQYYFPEEVRKELGRQIDLICDSKAAVIFTKETPLKIVLESLSLITKEIEHRLQLEKD